MKRRVVVTGLGAVTPIGNTVDVFWDEIKKEMHLCENADITIRDFA